MSEAGVATCAATPTVGDLLRRVVRLAAPTSFVSFLQVGGMLAETWLAARQGTEALAGWAVVLPFALLLQQMSAGAMGGGVVSAVARALGAGRRDRASALVLHALLIAVAAGLLFTIVLAGFPEPLFNLIAPGAAAQAIPFSACLFGFGAIPVWLTNVLASILRGGGRHGLVSRILAVSTVAYPLVAWVFMEPLGFGLPGAGMAVGLVYVVAATAMAAVVQSGAAGFIPDLRQRPTAAAFESILSVGLVASAMATIANLTTVLVTARIAPFGAAVVAAYGISARLEFLMVPLAFGIGSALTALVGQSVGAGDWPTARRIAWTGGVLALGFAGSVGLGVTILPAAFAGIFTDDPAVLTVAVDALRYVAPACAGFGVGMALYFASMGAARMRAPVCAALARIGIAVVGGWFLADVVGMGLAGHFLAVGLGITAYGAITAAAVRPGIWSARSGNA